MSIPVHILGAGRTDFRRNLRKEGKTLRDLIVEAGATAIADAGLAPGDISSAVVGNFAGGLFARQLHLGAYVTEIDPALRGIPTRHVEAACASGGVAVLTAAEQIMGGLHDAVLVIGAEQQKTMSPSEGAEVLGTAADLTAESAEYGDFLFPKLFARIAQVYRERYSLSETTLAKVAVKNRAQARLNPLAQMRESPLSFAEAALPSESNRVVAPPLKLSDCSPITDGAAALVLCSERFLRKLQPVHSAQLLGYGHTTDFLSLERKEIPDFPIARKAADRAYAMAGLGPSDIQGAEVHDCFTISELVQCELLGLAAPGEAAQLLERGDTSLNSGRCPVNAGGGLLGDGHPVGATGVRQIVEIYRQLTGRANLRQIEGVKRYLACNIGGSMTTTVVTIWGAP